MSEQTQPPTGSLPFGGSSGAARAGAASGAQAGPDLLSHLEQRVTRLVERYGEAKATIEQLETRARERDAEIAELRHKIEALGRARGAALERLDAVISEIEQLEKGEGTDV